MGEGEGEKRKEGLTQNHSFVVIRRGFVKFYKDRDKHVRYLRDDAPRRAKYDAKLDQPMAPEPSSSGR